MAGGHPCVHRVSARDRAALLFHYSLLYLALLFVFAAVDLSL
jgi:heme O synthase-like polyprenyltransferase